MNWYDYILVPLSLSLFLAAFIGLPILAANLISAVKGLKEENKRLEYDKGEK